MPNLFPEDSSFEVNNLAVVEDELEFKGSYLIDFEKGEFVKNPDGTIAKCDDLQAYIQWCHIAINTPRNKYAYSNLFGQDFKELIGSGLSKSAIELEIQRMTRETLMVHPRTREVTNFTFKWTANKEEVYYEYEVITIYDENITFDNTLKVG